MGQQEVLTVRAFSALSCNILTTVAHNMKIVVGSYNMF